LAELLIYHAILSKHLGVNFLYEKAPEAVGFTVESSDSAEIRSAQLQTLPDALLTGLRRAVEETDPDAADIIINDIQRIDVSLANALTNLVKRFRFDLLQKLLEELENE